MVLERAEVVFLEQPGKLRGLGTISILCSVHDRIALPTVIGEQIS